MENKNEVLYIDRSIPFDLEEFIGHGWSIVDQDNKALDISSILISEIILEKIFGEKNEDKIKYLNEQNYVELDPKVLEAFWNNQELIPEEWKKESYVFFGALVFKNCYEGEHHFVLCLYWRFNQWHWGCYDISHDFVKASPCAIMHI